MPPEAATSIAPAAAPASTPAQAPAPSPAPPISVVPGTGSQLPPPKPGSARDRMFKELRKKAGVSDDQPPQAQEDSDSTPPEPQTPSAATDKKPKVNPWKLLDEYKAARAKAENELAELRKLVPNEAARKEEMEKLQKYEARARELEEEIRFTNYSKSQEFQEKYQKPYEKAWKQAMEDLKEITIGDDESGESRPVQPQDILELVNMPLGKARETANAMFGEFADDVMAHRKEIRNLFDRQEAALAEARQAGEARERERMDMFQRQQSEFQKWVSEVWKQANDEAIGHEKFGKLFQPIEGDDDGNERLKKGYALVDKALAESPTDPSLTAEQRVAVIKRHAAVRHRAAAFGRLRFQNEQLQKKTADLEAKLKQYETSTPTTSSVNAPSNATLPQSTARAQVFDALHKIAK